MILLLAAQHSLALALLDTVKVLNAIALLAFVRIKGEIYDSTKKVPKGMTTAITR